MFSHKTVLLEESIDGLLVREGEKYIDATLGGGGHTIGILNHGGLVLGIDMDIDAIDHVKGKFEKEISNKRLILTKGNFVEIESIAHGFEFNSVSGIIFDLGVSSYQIDNTQRGFSYQRSGPLDMRMDKDLEVSATDLVNVLEKNELIKLFNNFGDEYRGKDIAERIIRKRKEKPIKTTDQLVGLLAQSYKLSDENDFGRAKSSKKVFQALRIAVNDELVSIETAIPKAFALLKSGGRLVIITFHSLEDRIVKKGFIALEKEDLGIIITKKPIYPMEQEIKINSRSKSSKLRIIEKK